MSEGYETHGLIETFTDYDDASYFLSTSLYEMAADGWSTVQGSGIQYVNYQWRVGLQFEREKGRTQIAKETVVRQDTRVYKFSD